MTKELSKQLCELCWIKPKIKCHPWECPHVGYYKRDKCIINFKPDEECVKRRDLSGYISYPDFGKPENFVKLFNLKWYLLDGEYGLIENSLAYYILFNFSYSLKDWNTTGFIRLLVKVVQDKHCPESIKQAIKETEWLYD